MEFVFLQKLVYLDGQELKAIHKIVHVTQKPYRNSWIYTSHTVEITYELQ